MSEKGISFSANENQDSSGDLNSPFSPSERDFERSIEPLEIENIQHFSVIPDFIDPTRSPYPIIVRSPSFIQCVDGWELIKEAQKKGETALTCEIIHIQRDSEIEVAIWKTSVRTMPIGGTCSYPEKMGNTCRLFTMLCESTEDPVVFSHGGARRGEDFADRPENNIRIVLAERLGKSVTTINKYLNHGEFLSEEALQTLIRAGVQKGFFEAIQKDKQRLIDELKSEQKSHDEIVEAVSERILSWLEEFQTSDPAEVVITQTDQDESPVVENQLQPDVGRPSTAKPIEHKHWGGNPTGALKKQPTEDDICQEFITIGRLLIETAENKALTTQERIQVFTAQVIRQPGLIQHLNHLLAKQSTDGEEQR
jgi:hypothetical protein